MNVLNPEAVDALCAELSAVYGLGGAGADWATRTLRKHCLRTESLHVPVHNSAGARAAVEVGALAAVPGWAEDALAKGETLHLFDLESSQGGADFLREVRDVCDWIAAAAPPGLDRTSFPQAREATLRWHAEQARASASVADTARRSAAGDVVEVGEFAGRRVVRIASEAELKREGTLMGHCVGGYWRKVSSGASAIFSVRDANDAPHVTVEVSGDGRVVQVKGRQNAAPVDRWRASAKALLKSMDWKVSPWAADDLGMVAAGGSVWDGPEEAASALADAPSVPSRLGWALARALSRHRGRLGREGLDAVVGFLCHDVARAHGEGMALNEHVRFMHAFGGLSEPRRIVKALAAPDSTPPVTRNSPLVSLPGGRSVDRVTVSIPAFTYEAVVTGLVPQDDDIARRCAASADAALDVARQRRGDVVEFRLEGVVGRSGPAVIQFFAFSGRLNEFLSAQAEGRAEKSKAGHDAAAAARRLGGAEGIRTLNVEWPRLKAEMARPEIA